MAIKVGTEDKKKVYLASGLGAVMLILLVRFLWQNFGPSPAPPPAPAPVVTVARPAATTAAEGAAAPAFGHQAAKVGGLASLDPTLHPEIMRQAESLEYTGHGRNIFSQFSAPPEIPKPIASIRQAKVDPDLLRLPHRPPSTWGSMAMRQSGPARDRCFCCMETTFSSRRRGMWSTGVIG